MNPIVFAGPSLSGITGISLSIDRAPPAGCGDIMRAVLAGQRTIGLVDGLFESGPAVWHKEILFALDAGCTVYGAASMGALRAAECWEFGMIGVGTIFEDYRSARRTADADVALVHGPAELDYVPLSVPLVDVDDVVQRACQAGLLEPADADLLFAAASAMHFKSRTWDSILNAAWLSPQQRPVVADWIETSGPGLKTRDAMQLLHLITGASSHATGHHETGFAHTQFSSKLLQSVGG